MAIMTPARAGLERAGASRAGVFTPNVIVLIGGVDRTAMILLGSLVLHQQLNEQPDTATCTIVPGSGFVPVAGSAFTVSLGHATNPIFGGQILRVTRRYLTLASGVEATIDVECVDHGPLLDRRLVLAHYTDQSASLIAADLIATYTSGFSGASIAPNLPTIDDFPVTNESVSGALQRLTHLVDGGYYDDAAANLHLFGVTGDASAKSGTVGQPLAIALTSLKALAFTDDISQIRTRVIVDAKRTTCPVSTPDGTMSVVTDASVGVDLVLVAGGGGGKNSHDGGGGGGGGGVGSWTETMITGTYPIVIGGGGAAGVNGSASTCNGHTAVGGGAGGADASGSGGGCGGGGDGVENIGGFPRHGGGGGTAGQGSNGGAGDYAGDEPTVSQGGGGGGGGGAGGSASGANGGNGGPGHYSAISGTPQYYGGGGGGRGIASSGSGGLGGGGASGAVGAANTGGGGGAGAAGGSGRAILSYLTGAVSATGGTITTAGGRTIHTFTSNGNFVISTTTVILPAPRITDLPIADASQLERAGGTVRMGTTVLPYLNLAGPIVEAGTNLPGSTVSSAAAATDTVLTVTNASTVFTESTGWVAVGGQILRYSGVSATQLTGIPASGLGAITAPITANTAVTWLGSIVLSTIGLTLIPGLVAGTEVVQRIVVDDVDAQAALAAIEGGDGIHEFYVEDDRLSVAGATARGSAELADFHASLQSADWETEDLNARAGRLQTISFADLNVSLLITRCDVTFPKPNYLPRRRCQASTVRTAALLDAVVTA